VAGPITFDVNAEAGKIEWFIKKESLCRLAGTVYEDKTLLKKHLTAAKREVFRLLHQLTAEEVKAILRKEEPETFKVEDDELDEELLHKLLHGVSN